MSNNRKRTAALAMGGLKTRSGRAIPEIVDPLGRVYESHPYNMPDRPFAIAHFSTNHLEAMMDTTRITPEMFEVPDDFFKFKRMLVQLRTALWMEDQFPDQPAPHVADGEWVLFNPRTIWTRGRLLDQGLVYEPFGSRYFTEKFLKEIRVGEKAVAVVKVYRDKGDNWVVAFEASSEHGVHQLSTIRPCDRYDIQVYSVKKRYLKPLDKSYHPQFDYPQFPHI